MPRVELGDWETMRRWAAPIRCVVFVGEQKVPAEMEVDDWDPQSIHAVAFDTQSIAIGTGRLLPDGHRGRADDVIKGSPRDPSLFGELDDAELEAEPAGSV